MNTMEEVGLGLEEWELKNRNLEKAFKICHTRCKKVEDHFNSTRNSLNAREEEIELREKHLKEKESYFESLRVSKEEQLAAIEKVIREKLKNVEQVKTELEYVSFLVEEKSQVLNIKEKRCSEVEKLVRENEREYELIRNWIEERTATLRRIEKLIGDLDETLHEKSMVDSPSHELERKMRKLYQQAKDHELNQAQFDIQLNTEQSEHAPGDYNQAIPSSVTNTISSVAKRKKLESAVAANSVTYLSSNVQPYDTRCQRNVPGFSEDKQHKFVIYLADFILILIQKKHIIEAVRFICTFKLIDKLPPIPLLKEYVEDEKKCFQVLCRMRITLDEKVKAADNLIGYLRAVHQCIKDYNLETELSADIEIQVVQLEKLKNTWRLLAPFVGYNDEQKEQRKRKEPDNKTCSPEFKPGQQSKLRTSYSSGPRMKPVVVIMKHQSVS